MHHIHIIRLELKTHLENEYLTNIYIKFNKKICTNCIPLFSKVSNIENMRIIQFNNIKWNYYE